MGEPFHIAMLWVEGPLSYLEQLCVKSFLDNGHDVTLYHYGDVSNVPAGATLTHGREILDIDRFIAHGRTGSMALFSDVFRYHMLMQKDRTIWADTDAYCMRPFETETGHFFGWESKLHINGGVLGLPQDSEALGRLLEMTQDEYGIPFWYDGRARIRMQARIDAGDPVHVSDLPWGVWGPQAVTKHLQHTGEDKYAMTEDALYPVPYGRRRMMVRASRLEAMQAYLTDNTRSIHLYGRRMRHILAACEDGRPEPGSLIDQLLDKHEIDPGAAPVQIKTPEPAGEEEEAEA